VTSAQAHGPQTLAPFLNSLGDRGGVFGVAKGGIFHVVQHYALKGGFAARLNLGEIMVSVRERVEKIQVGLTAIFAREVHSGVDI